MVAQGEPGISAYQPRERFTSAYPGGMTIDENADLHKRVERYEAAVDELRSAHQDVRELLIDQVLFERWQQLGAELGFSAMRQQPGQERDLSPLTSPIPAMTESWAS
jgi:hypothetical protein